MRTFGVLIMGLVAIVAGFIGYQIGITSTADAARVVYVGGGFPGFGSLFFLFFIGLIFFSLVGRRRAWGGWGGRGHWGPGYGRGPWGGPTSSTGTDATNDPRRQWVADMHRSLHETDAKAPDAASSTPSTRPANPPTAG